MIIINKLQYLQKIWYHLIENFIKCRVNEFEMHLELIAYLIFAIKFFITFSLFYIIPLTLISLYLDLYTSEVLSRGYHYSTTVPIK